MNEATKPGLLETLVRHVRIGMAVIAFLGVSNAAVAYWVLEQLVENATRVEAARSEVLEKVSAAEQALRGEIAAFREEFASLRAALGQSPEAIQRAAISVSANREELDRVTQQIVDASSTVRDLQRNFEISTKI